MNNSFFNNKRGGEKYLSVYWFLVLVLVAGGVIGMVTVYYGSPYDIREIEGTVLINKIADCVSYEGRIDKSFISNGIFYPANEQDFLKACHLNLSSTEWTEQQYYFQVDFYKLSDLTKSVLNISSGNKNYISFCALQKQGITRTLPTCVEKSFYSLDDLGNEYIIKILTAVRKSEKNVKI